LFVQMIGRGLRTADGKADCLVLDHSDNHTRLGFITDIHHNKLDDGKPRPTKAEPKAIEKLPKPCPKCTFLKPPKILICPACGFKPEPKCSVANQDGELVEFSSRNVAKQATQQDRMIFHAELRHIAAQRGWKPGWAGEQYKIKFGGGYPPWSWNDLPTRAPTAMTLSWVRSKMIAYAKARAAS
jgi:superfamily II DNA or RNA helicase